MSEKKSNASAIAKHVNAVKDCVDECTDEAGEKALKELSSCIECVGQELCSDKSADKKKASPGTQPDDTEGKQVEAAIQECLTACKSATGGDEEDDEEDETTTKKGAKKVGAGFNPMWIPFAMQVLQAMLEFWKNRPQAQQ